MLSLFVQRLVLFSLYKLVTTEGFQGWLPSSFKKYIISKEQAVHKRKLTQIKNEASWDETQAKNANTSLKDEWFVFLLSIPMIGAFVPDMVPYVKEGFVVLNEMPEFYKAFLGAAIAASFGIKSLANWKK